MSLTLNKDSYICSLFFRPLAITSFIGISYRQFRNRLSLVGVTPCRHKFSNIHKKKKQYITGCKSCLNFRYKQYLANSGIGIALEDKIIRSTFDIIRDVSIYHRSKF